MINIFGDTIYGKHTIMTIQIFLFVAFGAIAIWMLANPLTKKKNTEPLPPLKPQPTPEEINRYEDPVENDPEPTPIGEMPIKPLPINCQKAIFRPAPEKFIYTDCCGKVEEGEGYQPWEKRSPVSIDVNQYFEGMDLIGEDGDACE